MSNHSHSILASRTYAEAAAAGLAEAQKDCVAGASSETVRAVVEAAARVLERHGLAGYTTNAVAARAGVSIGSLYQYFPHKDALTAALIERETAIFLAGLDAAGQSAGPAETLRRLIGAAVAHQLRRPVLARLLDIEERRLPLHERELQLAATAMRLVETALPEACADLGTGVVAGDLIAIVKGMVDAAGERGETDAAALENRVGLAVFGYVEGVTRVAAAGAFRPPRR